MEGKQLDASSIYMQSVFDKIYPVGSIYMSVNSTSPASLFGGTWTQLKDRFLVGAGNSYAVNSTGGSTSQSYTPKGSVGGHTLTVSEMPRHGHNVRIWNKDAGTTDYHKLYSSDGTSLLTNQYGIDVRANESYIYSWNNTNKSAQSGLGDEAGTTTIMGGGGSHNHGFTGTAATISTTPPIWVSICGKGLRERHEVFVWLM